MEGNISSSFNRVVLEEVPVLRLYYTQFYGGGQAAPENMMVISDEKREKFENFIYFFSSLLDPPIPDPPHLRHRRDGAI